jgi:acyl-coenzyme A synthetase/AMP-(fatty) acid ligase
MASTSSVHSRERQSRGDVRNIVIRVQHTVRGRLGSSSGDTVICTIDDGPETVFDLEIGQQT